MKQKIFFDHISADDFPLPHYYLGDTAQRYLYYCPTTDLIKRAIDYRASNVKWSDSMYFDKARKIINALRKTNYDITVCAYWYDEFDPDTKVYIAACAVDSDRYYPTNYPEWFIKE